jgi:hypothetical protein
VGREEALDGRALYANASSVDYPDLSEARIPGGAQVLIDDGEHVAGRECVQVDRILDRDDDGVVLAAHGLLLAFRVVV